MAKVSIIGTDFQRTLNSVANYYHCSLSITANEGKDMEL